MRQFSPLPLSKGDTHPTLYNVIWNIQDYLQKTGAAFAKLDRGEQTNQSEKPISLTGVTDHGALTGLVPTAIDRNDDHTQYLNIFGRTDGQTAIGNLATSYPGADKGLNLQGYDLFTGSLSSRAGRIELNQDATLRVSDFIVVERDSTYGEGDGFVINTGAGFANATLHGGTLFLKANSAGGSPQLNIDNTAAGGSAAAILAKIKKKASQTGDMLQFLDNLGAVMSYIRASDGAFVGPVSLPTAYALLNTDLFSDVVAASPTRGDLIVANSTPKWARVAVGGASTLLKSNGTDPSWGTVNLLSAFHGDTSASAVVRGGLITGQGSTPAWAQLSLGASGKYLTSDGTDIVWGDPPAASAHNILSSTHSDTLSDSVVRGDVLIGNSTPKWARLPRGSNGDVLTVSGSRAASHVRNARRARASGPRSPSTTLPSPARSSSWSSRPTTNSSRHQASRPRITPRSLIPKATRGRSTTSGGT